MKQYLRYKEYGLKRSIQSAAFQKTVHDIMKTHKTSRQKAVLALLYDDFLGDLWNRGKNATADFWSKNKDTILDLLKAAATQIIPKLISVGGNKMKTEDPYAVDTVYLRSLFDPLQSSACPRETLDPMAIMKNRFQIPIVTGTSGIATVVLNPYGMSFGNGGAIGTATQDYFPFATMSSSNTNIIYTGTNYAGPFNSQLANLRGYYPDQLKTSFICTQSALNAQGKITAGLYYTPPNASLQMNGAYQIDGTTASVTSAQVLNSSYAARVYNVPQCLQQVVQIVRWIPTANDFEMDPIPNLYATGSQAYRINSFLVIVFTGCTPSSTIGNLYISSAMSFKPTAGVTGIYDVQIRGSYQGTHRWLHQLRKSNIAVQFQNYANLQKYFVQNFAQLQIGSGDGFCVDVALQKLGLTPFGRPWVTVSQLEARYPGLATYSFGKSSRRGLVVDLESRHAYVNQPEKPITFLKNNRPKHLQIVRDLVKDRELQDIDQEQCAWQYPQLIRRKAQGKSPTRKQILCSLLQGGIEPNPGPHSPYCQMCAVRLSIYMRALQAGNDVSEMKMTCDDVDSDQDEPL